jgi:hypothetical protein
MSKTLSYILIGIFSIQIILSWVRYPSSNYRLLLIIALIVLAGCLFFRDVFKDPLRRCPLCGSWLKINDYKFISNDGMVAVILCKKCNREYKIRKE